MTLNVSAALGGPMELIGATLREHGLEDASGARRVVVDRLQARDFASAARLMGSTEAKAEHIFAIIVEQWGEPPLLGQSVAANRQEVKR